MRILLPIDRSECSNSAVDSIAKRSWPEGTVVRVLSIIEPVTLPVPEAVALPETWCDVMRRDAHSNNERIADRLRQVPNLEIETDIRIGLPAEIIVQESAEWLADLIVVGSHGRGRAGRFLFGSVSQDVALNAPCSVEIIRANFGTTINYDQSETKAGDSQIRPEDHH